MSLLSVHELGVSIAKVYPLTGVSFELERGEKIGIVGESGSGKSLTAMSVMGLLPLIGGQIECGLIEFDKIELTRISESELRKLRGGRIGLITQNPMTSLDPLKKIGSQVDDVSRLHLGLDNAAAKLRTIGLLADMRIPEPESIYHLYQHQMSGGMKQRIVIAMALAADPDLLIADEPTTALDVTVQAQIILLLDDLVKRRNLSLILITHDMSVVAQTCDKVMVMYAGTSVESGPVEEIFASPSHPYTKALIDCIPQERTSSVRLQGIGGTVPGVAHYPAGCRFHPRCAHARDICRVDVPVFTRAGQRGVACHFALEIQND